MWGRFLQISLVLITIFSHASAYGQETPLKRSDIKLPTATPQIVSPSKLEEFRRSSVSLPATITRVEIAKDRCAGPGRTLKIYGSGFGLTKGRSVKIIRRLELGTLRVVNWSAELITGIIPNEVPDRSYYEIVVSQPGRWVSNLVRVNGCGVDITMAGPASAVAPRLNTLVALFPRESCRAVNLDTLDVTYEGRRAETVFRIVDDRGTVVSFRGWSYDQVARSFFYILDHWLTNVCYGPRMGNYDHSATYRLMLWVDRLGQVPSAGDFPPERSACYHGCASHTLNRQFVHCRDIPRLTDFEFGRVEPNIRDTRTPEEYVPYTTVPVWGIRRPHVHGPRTFYSVDDWPLFTDEDDVVWAKRYFARPVTVCTFGAFNSNYENSRDEHDGMQLVVR